MSRPSKEISKTEHELLANRLAPIYQKIGAVTFFFGLITLLIGLWIDRTYKIQPFFTINMVVIIAPIVIWFNARILKRQNNQILEQRTSTTE